MDTAMAFLEAVMEGDLPLVRQMTAREPALVHARNRAGISAVLIAIYHGEAAVAEHLMACRPQLDIFEAAAAGHLEQVRWLLAEHIEQVHAYAPDGFSPLILAAYFGRREVVGLLLACGAQVNARSQNVQRVTALHAAVAGQHLDIARMLLAQGADVNGPQADGLQPLHAAVRNGQVEMVQLLLAHGADGAAQTKWARTGGVGDIPRDGSKRDR